MSLRAYLELTGLRLKAEVSMFKLPLASLSPTLSKYLIKSLKKEDICIQLPKSKHSNLQICKYLGTKMEKVELFLL